MAVTSCQTILALLFTFSYFHLGCTKEISIAERRRCHRPRGRRTHADCAAYVVEPTVEDYGEISDLCLNVTWRAASSVRGNSTLLGTTGSWGSCTSFSESGDYRMMVSNSVPDYYFGPYCPLGLGLGYCIGDEECSFDGMICGDETSVGSSAGFTPYGDVWYPNISYYKVPMVGNPTRDDRPGDMYEAVGGGEKNIGAAVGFTIQNGVSIQGPNDAGDWNIDEAGFILPCGGHVTPPTDIDTIPDLPAHMPPMYHYHKAPDCLDAFVANDKTYSNGGKPNKHGSLFAYALDGFGIYTYSDLGGATPVLDECGGHFGATNDDDLLNSIIYHYHSTTYTPYHLACQGPALMKCNTTQNGNDFCGPGCGAEICAQPGTDVAQLKIYLDAFNSTWFSAYTNNLV